jgi:hypothetical protein
VWVTSPAQTKRRHPGGKAHTGDQGKAQDR